MKISTICYWLSDFGPLPVRAADAAVMKVAPTKKNGTFDMRFNAGKAARRTADHLNALALDKFIAGEIP